MFKKFITTCFREASEDDLRRICDVCLAALAFMEETTEPVSECESTAESYSISTEEEIKPAPVEIIEENGSESEFITANQLHLKNMHDILKDRVLKESINRVKVFPFSEEFLYDAAIILLENNFKIVKFLMVKESSGGWYFVNFKSFCGFHGKIHASNNQVWMWKCGSDKSKIKCFDDGSEKILEFPMNI